MHELIIEPGRSEKNYWRDLWRYRELFYFLAWRDILVRYKWNGQSRKSRQSIFRFELCTLSRAFCPPLTAAHALQ